MYKREASTVLYIGSIPPSGKRLGISPLLICFINVLKISLASSNLFVLMQLPSTANIVSRPQSSNHGYPANIVFALVESL